MDLRQEIHKATDKLPSEYLADVLQLMETLISSQGKGDVEPEELWLLVSGKLKQMVDEIESAPEPVKDWRKHLHDL